MFNLKDYKKAKRLGKGTYSIVNLYEHKKTKKQIAVKKYIRKEDGIFHDMVREISSLQYCRDSNIIRVMHIDYEKFRYVVLPFYDFNLNRFLKKYSFTLNHIKKILYCLFLGVYNLHKYGLAHRDIKPGNVLIRKNDNEYEIVLIDTGMARNMDPIRDVEKTPEVVTHYYRAPELLISKTGKYGFEIDIWSLGCIFGQLLTRKILFEDESTVGMIIRQLKLIGTPKDNYYKDLSIFPEFTGEFDEVFIDYELDVKILLKGMLTMNPLNRFTVSECLNSDFIGLSSKVQSVEQVRDKYYENFTYGYQYPSDRISEEVTFEMRRIVVDWLLEVSLEYEMSDETYFASVYILDKFLITWESVYITRRNMQLIGITCLFISAKLYNVYALESSDLTYISDNTYNISDLEQMEKIILRNLEFKLLAPLPTFYLNRYASRMDDKQKREAYKNLYIAYLYRGYLNLKPSDLVKYACMLVVGANETNTNIIKYRKWIEHYNKKNYKGIIERFS